MAFFRKILDILNINPKDNVSTEQNIEAIPLEDLDLQSFPNIKANLYHIKNFWKTHQKQRESSYQQACAEDYLVYGTTLMLWLFEKAAPLKHTFPIYFESCYVSNPQKLQEQLLSEGYLEPASAYSALSSYTLQELKSIAEEIGCPKGGKKADLLDRICKCTDKETLNKFVSKSHLYTLSTKGNAFLQDNYDYVELHRHNMYDISLYEFNQNRFLDGCKQTFNANAYSLITNRIKNSCLNYSYYRIKSDYITLYKIALSEKHYDIALVHCLYVLYLESCCLQYVAYTCSDYWFSNRNYEGITIFTHNSATPLAKNSAYYSSSCIEKIYSDLSLPPSFLTQEEFGEMVAEIINSVSFDYKKYNQIIIPRLRTYSKIWNGR